MGAQTRKLLEGYFTETELADQLGVCRRTIQRWRSENGVGPPTTRIGRGLYFRAEAVREWLLRHERKMPRERNGRQIKIKEDCTS